MFFGFTFTFVGSELPDSELYFALLFLLVVILLVNIVFLQYEFGRQVTFWLSIIALLAFYAYDFAIHSSAKQRRVFFMPMFVEALVYLCGYLLYIF